MHLIPKDWSIFQHYKDRCPPWIKLHKELLNNRKFINLPTSSKALAPLLWLLASENKDGVFDASTEELEFRIRMPHKEIIEGLSALINNGFFLDASTMLAPCYQVASTETETETEKEKEESQSRLFALYSISSNKPPNQKIEPQEILISEKSIQEKNSGDIKSEEPVGACNDDVSDLAATVADDFALSIPNHVQPKKRAKKALSKTADKPVTTRLPSDWELPDEWAEWALSEQPSWDRSHAFRVGASFGDYWKAKGGADARKVDWFATWRNWVRRDLQIQHKNNTKPQQSFDNLSKHGRATAEAAMTWMQTDAAKALQERINQRRAAGAYDE